MKNAYSVVILAAFLVVFSFSNAMAEKVAKSFSVNGTQTLLLQNLYAKVTVKVGSGNSVSMVVAGDKKSIKDITMKQNDAHLISVKGKEGSRGGNSVTITDNGSMSIVASGDVVIVNGKVVSGSEKYEMVSVEITVPKGTNIDASGVHNLWTEKVNGKLNASVSGQDRLNVQEASGLKLKCSGQSECKVFRVSGDVRAYASGQSSILLVGNMRDMELDASGQSEIGLNGSCHDFEADASGQSEISGGIKVTGRVRKNTEGNSEISIR